MKKITNFNIQFQDVHKTFPFKLRCFFSKVYVHLCKKWKAYNRIIVVQEAPLGLHKAPPDRPAQLLAAVKTPSSASVGAGPSSPAPNSGNQAGASTSGQLVREVSMPSNFNV